MVHARGRSATAPRSAGSRARSPRSATRHGAAREPRRDEQREPGVQRDRRGRVAGRIARVDGERLEALDVGPPPLDEQRRRAVGRGLDGDGEERRTRRSATCAGRPSRPRRARAPRGSRSRPESSDPDPGGVGPAVRALAGDPAREALVEPLDAVDREQHLRRRGSPSAIDAAARRRMPGRLGRGRTRRRDVGHRRARRTAPRGHRDAARRAEFAFGSSFAATIDMPGSTAPALACNDYSFPLRDDATI